MFVCFLGQSQLMICCFDRLSLILKDGIERLALPTIFLLPLLHILVPRFRVLELFLEPLHQEEELLLLGAKFSELTGNTQGHSQLLGRIHSIPDFLSIGGKEKGIEQFVVGARDILFIHGNTPCRAAGCGCHGGVGGVGERKVIGDTASSAAAGVGAAEAGDGGGRGYGGHQAVGYHRTTTTSSGGGGSGGGGGCMDGGREGVWTAAHG
mmetsp:Transcript_20603/g.44537  ORF Transcript_20603/g.44537 Transcript_20603/m.44537 type:complete len:209 (-) Transcript_20603:41-667(-)